MLKTNEIVEELSHVDLDLNNAPITTESARFQPLAKAIANVQEVALESYFGKNPKIEKIVLKLQALKGIFGAKIGSRIQTKDLGAIDAHFDELDTILAEMLNVESVTMQIVPGSMMRSIPVGVGRLNLTAYSNMTDKQAMAEYNAYTVDADGVHYKHREGKHIVIYMGSMLLANPDMKAEFLTALLFREIGKSFLNFTYGYSIQAQRVISGMEEAINITRTVYGIFLRIKHMKDFVEAYDLKVMWQWMKENPIDDDIAPEDMRLWQELLFDLGKESVSVAMFVRHVITFVMGIPRFFSNLLMNAKDVSEAERITRGRHILGSKIETEEDCVHTIWAMIGQAFRVFDMVQLFKLSGFTPFQKILMANPFDATTITALINSTGGDKFPTYYGLGAEFSQAIIVYDQIIKARDAEKNGFAKFFQKVPGLNVVTQIPLLLSSTIDGLAYGELSTRVKILRTYKQLEKELKSANLNPALKKDLEVQLAEIKRVYDQYIDPETQKGEGNAARSFLYYIFRYFLQIKKSDNQSVDRATSTLIGVDTLKKSPDLIKGLKMSPKTELSFISSVEKTMLLATESSDVFQQKIVVKPHFEDLSVYTPLKSISFESYYGRTPIVEHSIGYVRKLREIIDSVKGKFTNIQIVEFKSTLQAWANELADEFNAESCYIGAENVYNAYAYPMSVGTMNEVHKLSKNRVIESNSGYKFEKKEGVHIIICIGIQLLADPELPDEVIAATVFHELGHGFQQYTGMTLTKAKSYTIYAAFIGGLKATAGYLSRFRIFHAIEMAFRTLFGLFSGYGMNSSRKEFKEDLEKDTEKTLDKIKLNVETKASNDSGESYGLNFIAFIIDTLVSFFMTIVTYIPLPGISSLSLALGSDPFLLTDLIFRGHYYSTQKKNERFADAFAAKYGLGLPLTKLLQHIYENRYDNATKIPLLRSIEQFNTYGAITILSLVDDHPTDKARIESIRDTLQNELVNNPDLPKTLRAEIEKELKDIQSHYDDITSFKHNAKNGRFGIGIIMWVVKTFFKAKEKAKTPKEIDAPVSASKAMITKYAISAFKSNPRIGELIGSTEDDISKYLSGEQLAEDLLLAQSMWS